MQSSDTDNGWIAPNRQGTEYATNGDPTFFFEVDLGSICAIRRIDLKNFQVNDWHRYYRTDDFKIEFGDAASEYTAVAEGTLQRTWTSIDFDDSVVHDARFIKFSALSYGTFSAALEQFQVFVLNIFDAPQTHAPTPFPTTADPTPAPTTYISVSTASPTAAPSRDHSNPSLPFLPSHETAQNINAKNTYSKLCWYPLST
jgi:hypothetical protein